MPGLLRGVARTAVVAGTATAVSNRVSRRQANRWAAQEPQYQEPQYAEPQYQQPPPPQPPAAPSDDPVERLTELAQLRDRGILTDEEFAAAKAKVLQS
ncbi:MAG: SHOCT domain-containing protein [Solirubrobacteraceae bacterium]